MKLTATTLAFLVLEHLPAEPNGLSVAELADGLLHNAGPVGRSSISAALREISDCLGGLSVRRGNDFLGHADVELFGLPFDAWSVVSRAWPRPRPEPAEKSSTCRTSADSARPGGGDRQE